LYCAPGTLLIEFFPLNGWDEQEDGTYPAHRWPEAVWWPAEFLGMEYYMIPIAAEMDGSVTVNPTFVSDILGKELL